VELLETNGTRPRANDDVSPEDREHKSIFLEWLRSPKDAARSNRLSEAQHEMAKKDVTIGSLPGGGYALPKQIRSQIEARVRQLNPFRSLVTVVQAESSDYHALVSLSDNTSGWSSETGTRTATLTPQLRDRVPTHGENYTYVTASNWSLDDLFFNVEEWLVNESAANFASDEATAIISGNGTNRPTGILNTTPVSTADDASPMRAANVIQFTSLVGFSPTSPVSISMDALINLVAQVKERYLLESDGTAFVMHRLTASAIRRLKASTAGSYLWQESPQLGQPATLLGYRATTCDAMPTIANDAFAVLFGNFRRGYILVDITGARSGMRVIVDQVTVPGQTKFYISRRLGGCILNNDAIKALRIAD
jgi:HK97 family phage major capsid protein